MRTWLATSLRNFTQVVENLIVTASGEISSKVVLTTDNKQFFKANWKISSTTSCTAYWTLSTSCSSVFICKNIYPRCISTFTVPELLKNILAPHSDSLDTILYVRFAIQNLEFYEWKLGDHGWALSWHRTHTLFAVWPDVTSCFTYEKTESEEVFSIVSYIRFKNLQFHWRIYNSIGVCILMRGVQWALWFVTSSWSECLSDQRFAAKLCARWAAKRRLISNVCHGVISLSILANKPSSFSYLQGLCNGVFVFKIGQKLTSNKARKIGLVTVVSLGVVSGEASANFERPSRSHFSLDSRQQAILV